MFPLSFTRYFEELPLNFTSTLTQHKTLMLLYAELSQGTFDNAEKTADEIWRQMVDTNLNSIYFFARKVGKVTLKQKYGRINIGSIHSTMAMKELPLTAYCATKGEVLMLTKALATEWAKGGIMLTQSDWLFCSWNGRRTCC